MTTLIDRVTSNSRCHLTSLPQEILIIILQHVFDGLRIAVRDATQPSSKQTHEVEPVRQSPAWLNIFLSNQLLHKLSKQVFFETIAFEISDWSDANLAALDFHPESSSSRRMMNDFGGLNTDNNSIIPHKLISCLRVRNFKTQPFLKWQKLRRLDLKDQNITVSDYANTSEVQRELKSIRAMQQQCAERGIRFEADATFVSWAFSRIRITIVPSPAIIGYSAGTHSLPACVSRDIDVVLNLGDTDNSDHNNANQANLLSPSIPIPPYKCQVIQISSLHESDFLNFRDLFRQVFDTELDVANPKIWDWLLCRQSLEAL